MPTIDDRTFDLPSGEWGALDEGTVQRYIDMTPTWAALLPAMLAVLDNPDESFDVMNAKMNIRLELARMAKAADLWNAHVKDKNG